MNASSIRTRLAFWHTSVLALALVVFSGSTWILVRHFLYADLQQELLAQLEGLSRYISIEERDPNPHISREIDEYSQSFPTRHLLAVFDQSGRAIYESDPGLARIIRPDGDRKPFRIHWRNTTYTSLLRTIYVQRISLVGFLALPIAPVERLDRIVGIVLLATVPIFILAGGMGGWWLSKRALAPVDAITTKARAIGVGNLSERLPDPGTRDELQRLTLAWNEMLNRLEQAVREIRQFTADASHELRTPLAIIRLAAENALRRDRSGWEYREALQYVEHQSATMTALLADLLALARADGQQRALDLQIIDVNTVIRYVVNEMKVLADANGITLTGTAATESIPVAADEGQIRRLLSVLLDNAIKYTGPGGTVSVTASQRGHLALIEVADTGVGIPPEYLSRIFERFFRIDPSRSKDSGGFGLGLAIAASIAKEHSATIEVEPNPSGGSVFTVSLPSLDGAWV